MSMQLPIHPFPHLHTERLTLRQLKSEDVDQIFAMHSDAGNRQYIDKPPAKSPDESTAFISHINEGIERREWVYWGMVQEDDVLIGTICLWNFVAENKHRMAEIGFELLPEYQGKGFMQEALSTVLYYGFSRLGLREIEAWTKVRNAAARQLLERNGFLRKSIEEGRYEAGENPTSMAVYSLLLPKN